MVTGGFAPVQNNSGFNFYLGNWPYRWHHHEMWDRPAPEVAKLVKGKREMEQERIFSKVGMSYIRENPGRAMTIFAYKFSGLWLGCLGLDPATAGNPIPHLGGFGIPKRSFVYAPLFVVAVLGWFCLSADSRKRAYPVMALLALWTLVYVVTYAVPRYAIPVVFYEIMLASVTIGRVYSGVRRRKTQEART